MASSSMRFSIGAGLRALGSVCRRTAFLGVLCATVVGIAGCGGGAFSAPAGGLSVAAGAAEIESIWFIEVTDNSDPSQVSTWDYTASPALWIAPGASLDLGDFPPGTYTVDVEWTDSFPESHQVVIVDGVNWVESFP